jgi:acyl-CoA synthetase (AMP-forming)/AMP-acid ligase II
MSPRLDSVLKGHPGADALFTSKGASASYARLSALAQAAADVLEQSGVGAGRVVAVSAADPLTFVTGALGAWALGATVLPLDPRAGPTWLDEMAQRGHALVRVCGGTPDALALTPIGGAQPVDGDIGLILFTSGSSGPPKAALLSWDGILANVDAILEYLPMGHHPCAGIVLPLAYSYALVGQVLCTLRAGASAALLSDVVFPTQQVKAMVQLKVEGVSSVPTSLRLLAQTCQALPESERPVLRYLASAGAPLDASLVEALRAVFPEARLFNQYGLTEASPRVAAISSAHPSFAKGAAGIPLRGTTVYSVDPAGERLGPGEEGELWVEGPSVMRGYLDAPEANAKALVRPGVLRTGDGGWVDDQGCVYVRGRLDGVVKCGGERVSVDEVAEILRKGLSIEVAVVAIPDERLGARLVAVMQGGASDLGQVRDRIRELPPAKRPVKILEVPALPRTGNGKVDRAALRELVQGS